MSRKMRSFYIIIGVIISIILVSACASKEPSSQPTTVPTATAASTAAPTSLPSATPLAEPTLAPTAVPTVTSRAEPNDFTLWINDQYISIREWDHEVDLEEILGKPLSEEIKVLDYGADTHTGSFVKTLEFDGLQMVLFSPKDNGKTYWIMTMEASKAGYKSNKGIEMGSTLEELKQAYPGINNTSSGDSADPNNSIYDIQGSGESDYSYLHFDIKEGIVAGIKVFFLIP